MLENEIKQRHERKWGELFGALGQTVWYLTDTDQWIPAYLQAIRRSFNSYVTVMPEQPTTSEQLLRYGDLPSSIDVYYLDRISISKPA